MGGICPKKGQDIPNTVVDSRNREKEGEAHNIKSPVDSNVHLAKGQVELRKGDEEEGVRGQIQDLGPGQQSKRLLRVLHKRMKPTSLM